MYDLNPVASQALTLEVKIGKYRLGITEVAGPAKNETRHPEYLPECLVSDEIVSGICRYANGQRLFQDTFFL